MMLLNDDGLPILDQSSEEGFVDLVFKINNLKSDDTHYYFDLFASHDNERVGLAIKIVRIIGPAFDGEMNLIRHNVYRHGVVFHSLGMTSDRLVMALAKIYGVDVSPRHMVVEETFTAIALHQADTELERHSVRLKLFGRDGESSMEDEYCESFFNIDLPNGWVFWNEKDPGYRTPLLKALSTT